MWQDVSWDNQCGKMCHGTVNVARCVMGQSMWQDESWDSQCGNMCH